ncbi:hypothetical protein [Neptuniibacter halophilus]|uniref:hypothetical protein n=1 Tax=Neptuniibacter halophilus TaxID=651666 RepID=UPI002573C0D0|nr:hypothetical protein [Neptuniibacter halophilus]
MISFITDQQNREPDILSQLVQKPLHLRTLEGMHLMTVHAPAGGWTHDTLTDLRFNEQIISEGVDAYLDDQWVGSTEV